MLVDRDNSAEPGREVVVFGTGLGGTIPAVGDGEPAPADPPAKAVGVLFGDGAFLGDSAIPAGDILFIGRAPGLVGVDQYNIRLRSDVPEGCNLPFWIKGTRSASQAVPISIRRGGGPCVEPTPLSYGSFRWQKTVSTGTPVPLDGEELVVDFSRNPLRVQPLAERLYPRPTSFWFESTVMPGPRCPVMDDIVRRLNVGDLRLWFYFPGGGELLRFSPDTSSGQPVYRVPLPEGTIRPGRFGVEATGSNEVEPFLTQVDIPEPIRVTTDLRAGMRFVTPSMFFPPPIRITWEGGDPQSAVMVTLREPSRSPVGWNTYNFRSWTALASRGEITITPRYGTFDIDVWNYREGEQGATFFTRGLDTPGRHGWRYQFIYGDLGYVLQPFRTSGN